jgi:hypothetical protein
LNFRPDRIEVTPDGREARLFSRSSKTVHVWDTQSRDGVLFARLVERPAEFGGGQIALISFNQVPDARLTGSLCAFRVTGDRDEPIWTGRITDGDLVPELRDQGYESDGFGVAWWEVQDVFPEIPGKEVIASFQHGPRSACSVCIYDLNGNRRYQIWHDGALGSSYWMAGPSLLLLCGSNYEKTWSFRGQDLAQGFPIVIFAVQPAIGHIGDAVTTTCPGGDTETLAWYKCLWPPESSDFFTAGRLQAPFKGDEGPRRFARFDVTLRGKPASNLSWLIDEFGAIVPDTLVASDRYRQDHEAPPAQTLGLVELPPVDPSLDLAHEHSGAGE